MPTPDEASKRRFATLPGDVAAAVEQEAKAERRSFANMAAVLIMEAIDHRRKEADRNS